MPKLESHLKTAGAMGALLFILYCLNIAFLPSDVALGDIIPLVLLLAQFALSLAWYVLLFALTGALFWNVVALAFHLSLPFRLFVAFGARLTSERPSWAAVPMLVRTVWRRVVRRFPISANPVIGLVGVGALLLLLKDYLRHGFGLSVPSVMEGRFGVQAILFASGCMYLFLVLQHFSRLYLPKYLRIRTVITSPLWWLAPRAFASDPRRAQVQATLAAAVTLVVCFPGGYSGLLQLSATSAGLRSDRTTVVLQKAAAYKQAFHGTKDEACHFYRIEHAGDVVAVSGVTVLFHGIGKRSLIVLPAFPDVRRLEIRSEDMRTVDEPLGTLTDSAYWFQIYSVAALVDLITNRALSKMAVVVLDDAHFQPLLKTLGRLVPSPSSVADAMANGVFKCVLKESDPEEREEVLEALVTPVKEVGTKR